MFYCIFPEGKQLVCHAISRDFKTWEAIPEVTFSADDRIYELLIGVTPSYSGMRRKVNTGCCSQRWRKGQPIEKDVRTAVIQRSSSLGVPRAPVRAESARRGSRMPRFVSNRGVVVFDLLLLYRMSRSLDGPWITPKEDTFDGRAFYAAKSVDDGQKRYLFGWNPTKNDDLFGWNPPKSLGKEYDTWDWGGKTFPYEVELERPVQLVPNHPYEIKVFIDGTICEMYFVSQGSAQINSVKTQSENRIPGGVDR